MELIEALTELDSENDEHWTAQGLPKMEVLKEMTGVEDMTRSMVDEAAPDYARTHRFDLTVDGSALADPDAGATIDPPAPAPVKGTSEDQEKKDKKALDAIEQLRREVDELRIQRGEADRAIKEKEAQLQVIEAAYQASRPRLNHAQVVQAYQRKQIEIRQNAANGQRLAAEAMGLDKLPVSRVGTSKLDRTMAGRRRASRNRPNVPSEVIS